MDNELFRRGKLPSTFCKSVLLEKPVNNRTKTDPRNFDSPTTAKLSPLFSERR
jgi:hypothetical protein